MATALRWGLLATGNIAHAFAAGIKESRTGTLEASASRSLEKSANFAEKWGGRALEGYEALLADPNVDAVYISTPHHLHAEWTIKAAEAGKHILCEKPFTLNAKEAEEALAAVKANGVFFMEAFMYRCAPQTRKLVELLEAKAIGDVQHVNAEFAFAAGKSWENFRTDGNVGGGGLMDVGSYAVSISRLAFGKEPTEAHYAYVGENYDESGQGLLKFSGGRSAVIGCGVHVQMRNDAMIYGSTGRIHISDPWKSSDSKLTLFKNGSEPEVFEFPLTGPQLYAAEADAVADFLEAKECPYVSWEDTLQQMRTLDRLRASAGYKFGVEK